MKLEFLGAARTVTGSSYLIETRDGKRFLVDCGMFQGNKEREELNRADFPYFPGEVDFLLLTHAHIDHSGLIPKLAKNGFRGQIVTTSATADLCEVMLPDSGHIQETEAEWHNRKGRRAGQEEIEPLYTAEDALACLKYFRRVRYDQVVELTPQVRVNFRDAGHILGSAIIEMWVKEGAKEVKIVFSGDLGNIDQPIIRDPTIIEDADYLVLESTYGMRLHETNEDKVEKLREVLISTLKRRGNLVIPSFAVGRTQDLLYELNRLFKTGAVPRIPTYIDSPLAVSATEIFRRNPDCFDEQTRKMLANQDDPFAFEGLTYVRTVEESKAINEIQHPVIIVSASGMADAGRIKHHLKHNLWRPECSVLFVGYQAEGTLGRQLHDGAKLVTVLGEKVVVKARIASIDGFSAHADQRGLLNWLGRMKRLPKTVFIVHGEEQAAVTLSDKITEEYGVKAFIPERGDVAQLASDGWSLEERRREAYEYQPAAKVAGFKEVAAGPGEVPYPIKPFKPLKQLDSQYYNLRELLKRALTAGDGQMAEITRQVQALEDEMRRLGKLLEKQAG